MKLRTAALTTVLIHLIVSTLHGAAHRTLGIGLSPLQKIFVLLVIGIAPVVSAFLIMRNSTRIGALVLILSMLGSLVFGAWNHYVVDSADNVQQVAMMPDHASGSIFRITAHLLAILEFVGTIIGILLIRPKGAEFAK